MTERVKRTIVETLVIFSALFMICFPSAAAEKGEGVNKDACEKGKWTCSEDAYTLYVCDGKWKAVECMRESGRLCESGACVDPWKYGSPKFKKIPADPGATKETLAQKAIYYERITRTLHLNPKLKWIMGVTLPCADKQCAGEKTSDCKDCTEAGLPLDKATWRDVERWQSGENDGLFSGLYLAAEAFHYGVTRDRETLAVIKTLLDAEVTRMNITGVTGIFTRQYIPPGVNGLSCPKDPKAYAVDVEKDDNQWVRINENGCVMTYDPAAGKWVESKHCGLKKYSGWCWLDNVSKDEYSGHIFALAALAKIVDDPSVQKTVKELLRRVGRHLVDNQMEFTDWDGRVAEHGRIRALTFEDYPGFNAAMALSFMKVISEVTGDLEFRNWYDNCLLQKNGKWHCVKKKHENPRAYTAYLRSNGLYVGTEGCKSNYNNIAMHMLSMFDLIWYERDPKLRERYQQSFDRDVFRTKGQPRAVMNQNNALYDFFWAAQKRLGPGSDGPAYDAVENGVRMMYLFPARKSVEKPISCTPEKCEKYCSDRFGSSVGKEARTPSDRCPSTFLWWFDPYQLDTCGRDVRNIEPPSDYLLSYWVGRYFGFIGKND
ncbi:MAG TPA: hypothetical protein PLQ76_00075 [bacterium]|nr:hypothetical protein [bacterium]